MGTSRGYKSWVVGAGVGVGVGVGVSNITNSVGCLWHATV